MTAKVGRVDHPVVAVHDLQASRQVFEKLGFLVPPSGKHQEWGTENVCIMFPEDYIEIRGVGDPNKFLAGLDKFLVHGEGLSGVAFNAKSAKESYESGIASGLGIRQPKHLNRLLVLENETLDLHFETVMLAPDLYPGLTHANLCEHLTADTLRKPEWLNHPNGVYSFGRIVGVVSDMESARDTYVRLLGAEAVHFDGEKIHIDLKEGADIELISPAEAEKRGDAHPARGDAYIAAATLLVDDLQKTKAVFDQNGIAYRAAGELIAVDPAFACGTHFYFEERKR
ncbi:VOC family protein [Paraburkholderia madseniana]|uniref:VOC family protein n=1 Tax=Paraburkholderia madseniana TaxID=2599607 RepID=A0A6N6W418_9BURK|nr:VOC family protein [Paraburkholderia madseniana]KAE8754961.1 VOC family protein [Paraburkholderia madseniana]